VRRRSLIRDRNEAGRLLGDRLSSYADRENVVVLALPRGGVPVAAAVARRLRAPLDVLAVVKLGLPGQEELAIGALGSGGASFLNPEVIAAARVAPAELAQVVENGQAELARRDRLYRGDHPALDLQSRTVILVDDGLATGATMRVAVRVVRARSSERVVVAVPVAPRSTLDTLRAEVDEVVCLISPEPFLGVSAWYEEFDQVGDDTVRALLAEGS
jgi:putative phosphoribosyl transferase